MRKAVAGDVDEAKEMCRMPKASITLVTAKAAAVKGNSKRRASISVKNKAEYIRRHLFKRCRLFVTRCRLVLPLNT